MTIHYLDPTPENGCPILLLHGLGADSRSWSFQFSALASSGYRPIAVDLPGFGQSTSLKGRWNIAAAADQTAMWMKESGYFSIPVVGISMGGTVALQLAIIPPGSCEQPDFGQHVRVPAPTKFSHCVVFVTPIC